MLLDKIDMMKHQACQMEARAVTEQFRRALLKHFEVVDANATRLINSRWDDKEG